MSHESVGPGLAAVLFSIIAPGVFQNKKEINFRQWVNRLNNYYEIVGAPSESSTTIMLLNLSSDVADTATCLGITRETPYEDAQNRMISHFSPIETLEENRTVSNKKRRT